MCFEFESREISPERTHVYAKTTRPSATPTAARPLNTLRDAEGTATRGDDAPASVLALDRYAEGTP